MALSFHPDTSSWISNPTLATIASLRTTHGDFAERRVDAALIETVIAASLRASSASGMQSYSIIVLDSPEDMQRVCGYVASHALIYAVDFTRHQDLAEHLGHRYEPVGLPGFITGCTNTILAAQTAAIAARSLGLEYLITNGIHRGNMGEIGSLLGLPPSCFPLITLYLGYSDRAQAPRKGRQHGPGIVHRQRYARLTPKQKDAAVRAYDETEPQAGLIADWAAKGHAHYLDWFFTTWVRRPAPEKQAEFARLLQHGGYLTADAAVGVAP